MFRGRYIRVQNQPNDLPDESVDRRVDIFKFIGTLACHCDRLGEPWSFIHKF